MKLVSLQNLVRFWEKIKELFVMQEEGKGLSVNDMTDDLKSNYDAAYSHSIQPHAPVASEPNVLEVVQRNGVVQDIISKTVDLEIPTEIGELENDLEYLTEHPDIETTSDSSEAAIMEPGSTIQVVDDITRTMEGHVIKVNAKDVHLPPEYEHPTSTGDGTWRKVIVNSLGHTISGENLTTRDGYVMLDVPTTEELNLALAEAIADSGHLKREIVEELPPTEEADEFTIYLILKTGPEAADNVYREFLIINGEYDLIGDIALDLSGYIIRSNVQIVSEEDIDSITEGYPLKPTEP